jgi:DNA polymerase-3 subunit delta'
MFADVVGHARAKEILARTLAGASVPSCLLFSGPGGVGKRRLADEFVRAFLCLEGGPAPCGRCESCRLHGSEAHPDRLAVAPEEKKKHISIDQARDLGTWIARSPALGRRKAAIVDPADALGTEAANALLKTLEEPPRGSLIVLVASRPGALPATVRSRCQQISFGALSDEEVAEVLRRNRWPAQAARQAAASAEGSPGAALGRSGKLWQESSDAVRALLESLEGGDRGAVLAFAESFGEGKERALVALQALIGFARAAARSRLGDAAIGEALVPGVLRSLGTNEICRLLGLALETHRRLEGDRPPNVKLAFALLLSEADAGGSGRRC